MTGWCCFRTVKKPTAPQLDPPQEIPSAECSDASRLDDGYTDPVPEEIWAIREKHGEEVGYDSEKLGQVYREYQKKFGDELIPAPEYEKPIAPRLDEPGEMSVRPAARAPLGGYYLPQDPAAREEIFRIWREVEAEYAILTDDEIAALEAAEYVDDPEDDEGMAEIHRRKWRGSARFGHNIQRYGEYIAECERRIEHLVEWVELDRREDDDEPHG